MEQSRRLHVVFVVVGVLSVLLSTCLGAFAGGLVGCWTGQRASRRIVQDLLGEFQERRRQLIRPEQPERLVPPGSKGALVTDVVDGSPADRAGIGAGDLILAVDGMRVDQEKALEDIVRSCRPGDRVEVVLWSGGHERKVGVRLGQHPEEEGLAYLGVYYVLPMRMRVSPPRTD